jgi:D-glycero-D-manno-heptose 1,7-bisphosphate phosphatase
MKQKAVFLDRDGVINNGDLYYTYKKEDFFFNEDVFESLKLLRNNNFILIIITNQGGISKGEYSKNEVDNLHDFMLFELKKQDIDIAEVYYCPHHDSIEKCICRKPDSGNIEKAIARFDIDKEKSYLIGDGERDIEAGQKAGLTCFKIDKNESILEICRNIINQKN